MLNSVATISKIGSSRECISFDGNLDASSQNYVDNEIRKMKLS